MNRQRRTPAIPALRESILRVWGTLRRGRRDQDLEEELRLHVELAAEAARRRGCARDDAAREARLAVGALSGAIESMRDQRGSPWLEDFARDLTHGVRLFRRSPVFTAASILSLALGIGATTAIFSLLDVVMFRPLAVDRPGRLVQLLRYRPPYGRVTLSYTQYAAFRDEVPSFDGVVATAWLPRRDVVVNGQPDIVDIDLVSNNYYTVLGIDAAVGRRFAPPADGSDRSDPEAMLNDQYWHRRFNADRSVIGTTIQVNGNPFTIVGVAPRSFSGITAGRVADVVLPITFDGRVRGTESFVSRPTYAWLSVIARLRDGRTLTHAQTELDTVLPRINALEAQSTSMDSERELIRKQTVTLHHAANGVDDLERRFGEPLLVLMAAVVLLLLITCANLANLLLARALARQPELALRRALGASHRRMIRQLVTEGLVLAVVGGALGVALAYWLATGLVTMMSNGGPRLAVDIRPDVRMLGFAVAVTLVACLLFSLGPALRSARALGASLPHTRMSRRRFGSPLLAVQVAVAILLVIGAGLFGRTLRHLYTFDAGFDRQDVVVFRVNTEKAGYSEARLRDVQNRIVEQASALPGVRSAAIAEIALLTGGGWDGDVYVEGHTGGDARAHLNSVGPGYFSTLGNPIVAGREFDRRDVVATQPVAIVNETFARFYFGEQPAIGRRIFMEGSPNRRFEIVGVAKDMTYQSLRQKVPRTVFFALLQAPTNKHANNYLVRIHRGAANPLPTIAATVAAIDPSLRAVEPRSMSDHIAQTLLTERLLTTLTASLGLLGLVLVGVGVYGVVAFHASRRTKEMGIRLALGARPYQVILLMVRETLTPVLIGIALGVTISLQVTGLAQTMLFGVTPTDAPTFVGSCAILVVLAVLAAWLPSRRASRLSPAATLRTD